MTRLKMAAGLVALAMVALSCGKADVNSPGTGGAREPNSLILRMSTEGGFIPQEYTLQRIPEFTLTGDGRVFTLGAQIAIYPGPAMPPLLVRPIESDGIDAIIAEAKAAGLDGPDKEYRYDLVADAGTTVFTFVDDDGKTHTIRAYALGFEAEGGNAPPGQTADEREARTKLAKLRDKLSDVSSWLPNGSFGEDKPAEVERLRVYASGYTQSDDGLTQPPKAWPLDTPVASWGAAYGDRYRCGMIEGAELDRALPAFKESNARTPWTSEGRQYELILRPLLPDETGCPQ